MRALVLVLLLAPALAGCLEGAVVDPADATSPVDAEVTFWQGARLKAAWDTQRELTAIPCWTGVCTDTDAPCEEGACERTRVTVPPGAGALTVSIRWPTAPEPRLMLRIEDAAGVVVARAAHDYPGTFGAVARLDGPPAGEYDVVVLSVGGSGEYEGAWRIEPQAHRQGDLLPDLVPLAPTDITLETPDAAGISYFASPVPLLREVTEATGARGCRFDEVVDRGAQRCLRFSNAVANLGEGPMHVRLDLAEGATYAAGGRFVQIVFDASGGTTEHDAGPAEWHAWHAHWHNAATTRYVVYRVDVETGARGDAVGEGTKGGVCFADTNVAGVGLPIMLPPAYDGFECVSPHAQTSWSMGITPGWFDLYPSVLSDQYVPLDGAPDGTYLLCTLVNAEGTLVEADLTNNEACATIQLEGDDVTVLSQEPYHKQRV